MDYMDFYIAQEMLTELKRANTLLVMIVVMLGIYGVVWFMKQIYVLISHDNIDKKDNICVGEKCKCDDR